MLVKWGTVVAQWLRCCATNQKVARSIPAGVIGIFNWLKILPIALWPWGRLSLEQKWVPGAFPGGKGGRCIRLKTLPPSCAVVMKPGILNFLEPSGPIQACNGTAFTACKIHIWGCYQSLWDLSLLTAVLMKIHIFKDVIPRQLVYTWRCSGGVCYLHLQGSWMFTNQHGITFQKTCVIFYVVFSVKHIYTHVLYKTITIHVIAPHTLLPHYKILYFIIFFNTQVWLFEQLLLQKNITFSKQGNENMKEKYFIITKRHKKNQSHYRPKVPRGFQEVEVPRLRDSGPGWW